MADISDFVRIRQGELTCLLAGCALVRPSEVMALLPGLSPDDLRDDDAQRFLLALKPGCDPVTIVNTLGLRVDSLKWLALTCDIDTTLENAAIDSVKEIKRLTIARNVYTQLKPYVAQLIHESEWRYA